MDQTNRIGDAKMNPRILMEKITAAQAALTQNDVAGATAILASANQNAVPVAAAEARVKALQSHLADARAVLTAATVTAKSAPAMGESKNIA
jgi:hypothetical protein